MSVADGLSFLRQLDLSGIVTVFWFTILLEVPRYVAGGLILAAAAVLAPPRPVPGERRGRLPAAISVIVAGHNEEAALRRCVESVHEQSAGEWARIEVVVVDDGSQDGMAKVAHALQAEGKVHHNLSLRIRGGKAAAVNLGVQASCGEFVIITDVDTTFDRGAFEAVLAPFADPRVGAVSGNLAPRNAEASLTTRYQAIEYLIGISLGRRVSETLGILTVVSGAFGCFRREALESVGGYDAEVGEDADLTMKLRRAGWAIRFAPDAWSLTDVPDSLGSLVAQRLRWNRSVVTIWVRKFRTAFDPRSAAFSWSNLLTSADVLVFQSGLSVAFLVYLVWLFLTYGTLAWTILAATAVVYVMLCLLSFLAAASVSAPYARLSLVLYVPLYAIGGGFLFRFVRLYAYVDELIFRRSYRDPYLPRKVGDRIERF